MKIITRTKAIFGKINNLSAFPIPQYWIEKERNSPIRVLLLMRESIDKWPVEIRRLETNKQLSHYENLENNKTNKVNDMLCGFINQINYHKDLGKSMVRFEFDIGVPITDQMIMPLLNWIQIDCNSRYELWPENRIMVRINKTAQQGVAPEPVMYQKIIRINNRPGELRRWALNSK